MSLVKASKIFISSMLTLWCIIYNSYPGVTHYATVHNMTLYVLYLPGFSQGGCYIATINHFMVFLTYYPSDQQARAVAGGDDPKAHLVQSVGS